MEPNKVRDHFGEEQDSNNAVQTRSSPQHDDLPDTAPQTQPDHASNVSDITTKPASKSIFPFLSLPGELRNLVYECPCIYETFPSRYTTGLAGDATFDLDERRQPAITRVNRQVRRETLGLFYSKHKFKLEMVFPMEDDLSDNMGPGNIRQLEKWNRGELEPAYVISDLLCRFPSAVGATRQTSNLRFLTRLSIGINVRKIKRVSYLSFTMSATVFDIKNDVYDPGLWAAVATGGLDWHDDKQVRAAYVKAIKSCPGWRLVREEEPDPEEDHESGGAGDTAGKLACGMSLIAREFPKLASNAYAFFEPGLWWRAEKSLARTLLG